MTRIAELCAGYGGNYLALRAAGFDVDVAWYAEKDEGAAAVMAHHHPGVPNLGDITAVDWTRAAPVDILTAGYPCQSFSNAGLRKGFDDDRAVWPYVADAIRDLRPRLVLLENVAGHLARGFGRVLGDLAALRYDAQWLCVRASDLGAPHQRNRVFIAAHPADADRHTLWPQPVAIGARQRKAVAGDDREGTGGLSLLPTPRVSDANGTGEHGDGGPDLRTAVSLLPTPGARLGDGRGAPDATLAEHRFADGRRNLDDAVALLPTPAARDADRGSGYADREGRPLSETVMRLLPTPTVADSRGTRNATAGRTGSGHHDGWTLSDVAYADRWGQYGPAIRRWEQVAGRSAPEPTSPGRTGKPRLSPQFVEWLMGLPAGHVTDLLPRNDALRVLGNGLVPIQGATAFLSLRQSMGAGRAA